MDALFIAPLVTARNVCEALSVSDPTARASIRALERAGILREADPNRKWGKIFIADQILSLIRGDE